VSSPFCTTTTTITLRVFESPNPRVLHRLVYCLRHCYLCPKLTVSGVSMTPLAYAPRASKSMSQHHRLGIIPVSYTSICLTPQCASLYSLPDTSYLASRRTCYRASMYRVGMFGRLWSLIPGRPWRYCHNVSCSGHHFGASVCAQCRCSLARIMYRITSRHRIRPASQCREINFSCQICWWVLDDSRDTSV
jgi:hypothetical protein